MKTLTIEEFEKGTELDFFSLEGRFTLYRVKHDKNLFHVTIGGVVRITGSPSYIAKWYRG